MSSTRSWFLDRKISDIILFDPLIDLLRRFKVVEYLRYLNVCARLFEKSAPAG